MYYLEDKHPKREYGCYIKVGNAIPYISPWRGTEEWDVMEFIKDIEKRHSRTGQHFYIDNDFYNNHYPAGNYVYYYRFLVREINDWEQFQKNRTETEDADIAA